MTHVLVRHKVKDYPIWKAGFDANAPARKAAGCLGTTVFHASDAPDNVVVLLEWDDLHRAQQFARSDDLREAMERAGVVDAPDVMFLDEAGRTEA